MSSLRFTSFGAATVPLSKIVVDKDLDMGPYAIKSVYRPEEWATETLEWGDVPGETVLPPTVKVWSPSAPSVDIYTAAISGYYTLTIDKYASYYHLTGGELRVNGVTVVTLGEVPWTSDKVMLNAGDVLSVYSVHYSGTGGAQCTCSVVFTGEVGGAKTFDLTGKWLALGIDMQGLAATVKIQGVEMPYSDYAKYFPLAPSELTISGDGWSPSQERPVLKVYK